MTILMFVMPFLVVCQFFVDVGLALAVFTCLDLPVEFALYLVEATLEFCWCWIAHRLPGPSSSLSLVERILAENVRTNGVRR